jgi:hypothetical protein
LRRDRKGASTCTDVKFGVSCLYGESGPSAVFGAKDPSRLKGSAKMGILFHSITVSHGPLFSSFSCNLIQTTRAGRAYLFVEAML